MKSPLALVFLLATSLAAQPSSSSSDPVFDVADLKVNLSGTDPASAQISNGRVTIRNVSLRILIAAGWGLPVDAVKGPDWLDDIHVDLIARAASPQTPEADLRVMTRNVLRERMKMVTRMEEREESVWALTILKDQPKLTPAEKPVKPEDAKCGPAGNGSRGIRMVCTRETMGSLARILAQVGGWDPAGKRVVDLTGLKGAWDFTIEWTPPNQTEQGGLALFGALQAQLGLKLESRKLPVPVVVVESMARAPTDN